MFADFGEITFARLVTDRATQRSRGFGFVSYKTKEAADRAIQSLNGQEVEGRAIEVKEADNADRRGPSDGPRNFDRPPRAPMGGGERSNECFAFKKGNCKFGDTCKYSHANGGGSRARTNDAYDESAPRKNFRDSDNYAEGRRGRE